MENQYVYHKYGNTTKPLIGNPKVNLLFSLKKYLILPATKKNYKYGVNSQCDGLDSFSIGLIRCVLQENDTTDGF